MCWFYILRDVDALLDLIAVSHLVEPLTVSQKRKRDTIDFNEDAVEMLALIASNRGQREERTVD